MIFFLVNFGFIVFFRVMGLGVIENIFLNFVLFNFGRFFILFVSIIMGICFFCVFFSILYGIFFIVVCWFVFFLFVIMRFVFFIFLEKLMVFNNNFVFGFSFVLKKVSSLLFMFLVVFVLG